MRLHFMFLAVILVLQGCMVRMGADPGRLMLRPAFPRADAWPQGGAGEPDSAATIDWVVAGLGTGEDGQPRNEELMRQPVYEVLASRNHGPCVVRELRRIGDEARDGTTLIDVHMALAGREPARDFNARLKGGSKAPFRISLGAAQVTGFVTAGVELAALSDPAGFAPVVERLVRDRAFTLQPPLGGRARGLIVHVRSFIDNPFEASVVEDFRRRGWAVLSGSFATPLSTVGGYDVPSEVFLPALAVSIAEAVDRVCAERAYAFEAALAYIAERHPEVAARPLVIVGFSAGSLGVPVIAARMPGRFDAGVLVCGGADILSISQRNPLGKIGLWVSIRGDPLAPGALARLSAEYRRASSLDPYATAPALTDIPILMLHAARDREIPADMGDLLYERLARPERWVFDGGHAWVFFLLPRLKGDIARWIEGAVAPGRAEDAVP